MNNTELAPVASIAVQEPNSLEHFKQGVDSLLARRSYFISQVLPRLKEGQDYFTIKGRKSLAKGGAEKLASIYSFTATFEKDSDTIIMLGEIKGLVAFICNLRNRDGLIVGQGRGADSLEKNQNDPNKTIKLSQKRAYTDAVIRATGLSDIFTQDLETVPFAAPDPQYSEQREWVRDVVGAEQQEQDQRYDSTITEKQRKYLVSLINSRVIDEEIREEKLQEMENLTRQEASSWIQELCSA